MPKRVEIEETITRLRSPFLTAEALGVEDVFDPVRPDRCSSGFSRLRRRAGDRTRTQGTPRRRP